jgi:hypothetical protein
MTVKMNTVNSTSISEIGYKRRTMHVKFLSGKIYEIKKVPRVQFDKFSSAQSKGKFFNKEIKNTYPSVELS